MTEALRRVVSEVESLPDILGPAENGMRANPAPDNVWIAFTDRGSV